MFGFGKKEESAREAMAREMRQRTHALRQGMPVDTGGGEKGVCKGCVFALGFVMAAGALAAMNLAGTARDLPFRLPGRLGDLLSGAHPPSILGDRTQDTILASAAQALALCLLAAGVPLCARLWTKLRDQTHANLYVTVWGVSVCLPFAFFFIRDFFGPLVLDIFSMFA